MTDINAWASELLGKGKTLWASELLGKGKTLKDINTFRNMLKCDIITVEYLKKDKTKTTIECTLDKKYIPHNVQSAIPPQQSPSDTSITVWSVDRGGWRRLSFDSIIGVALSSKTDTPKNNGVDDSFMLPAAGQPASVHTLSTKLSKMQAKELGKWLQKMADSQKEALNITIEQCLNTGMLISITNNTTKQTLEL